ncbi:MAG: hypothetical protein JWO05_1475 [Gemmatimonadetes bacterium]|nr:hypothetical protein [Gemmatimonadota bacterium]
MGATIVRTVMMLAGGLVLIGASGTCPSGGPSQLPADQYGGDHMGLVVADSATTIEYDCATGRMPGVVVLDGAGRFDVAGVFVRGHGGPIRVGEPEDAHAARYSGRLNGKVLDVTVTVTDQSIPAQSYSLRRGQNPRVFKCL